MFRLGKKMLKLPKKVQFLLFLVLLGLALFTIYSLVGKDTQTAEESKSVWEDPELFLYMIATLLLFPFALNMILNMFFGFAKKVPVLAMWIRRLRIRGLIRMRW